MRNGTFCCVGQHHKHSQPCATLNTSSTLTSSTPPQHPPPQHSQKQNTHAHRASMLRVCTTCAPMTPSHETCCLAGPTPLFPTPTCFTRRGRGGLAATDTGADTSELLVCLVCCWGDINGRRGRWTCMRGDMHLNGYPWTKKFEGLRREGERA